MKFASRGLPVLAGGVAIAAIAAIALPASALATPASAPAPAVARSCSQQVAKGHYTCFALKRTDIHETHVLTPDATPAGYGPTDLKSAYKLPTSSTTATIAIVDAYDDPAAESDLATYRSQYGLSACTTANGCFRKVNQNGQASPLPQGDTGWSGEISLDLDAVSATCPSCHILLVEADDASDNLFTAVDTARTLGAKYISMSWGGGEGGAENSYDTQYFNHTGIVYTASSGDSGYYAGAIYPSTSQYVVSVGGTTLNPASGTTRGWSESVWDGAGSGCSTVVTKPAFQSGISACTTRADTDVSAVADPNTGLAVYQTYGGTGWSVYGGTSASAPQIAAVYALAGTPGASDRPASYPYTHATNLYDVTTGSNGSCSPTVLCRGGAGWDGPTGIGTPDGTAGFTAGGRFGNLITVTNPGNQTGIVGTALTLQIHATDSAPGQTLTYSATGLPAGLSINSSTGLISGTPTTSNGYNVTVTATDTTSASGQAAFTWTINGGGGGGCSGQRLVNPGFESGSASWTATSGVINTDGAHSHSRRRLCLAGRLRPHAHRHAVAGGHHPGRMLG